MVITNTQQQTARELIRAIYNFDTTPDDRMLAAAWLAKLTGTETTDNAGHTC